MSLLTPRRSLPLAVGLLALAALLATPPRAAAVMTTPPAKLASWGLDQSASGRPNEQTPATHDRIRVNEPCGYELASGRSEWLSRDPIGEMGPDGPNLYGYVRNNPLNYLDPDGLSALSAALPWAGGAAIADGPVPVGDIIAGGILLGAGLYDLWNLVNHNASEGQPIDAGGKKCDEGDLVPDGPAVEEPSIQYPGGRSVEQPLRDLGGRPVTRHELYDRGGKLRDKHWRPGSPKGGKQ